MDATVPSRTILKEKVDIVGCFTEVCELDDVPVVDALPGLDLVLQRVDEVLLGQALVLGVIDFLDEVLLGDHLAGEYR